jgi:hypothetical protein
MFIPNEDDLKGTPTNNNRGFWNIPGNFRWELNHDYLVESVLPALDVKWPVHIRRTSCLTQTGGHTIKLVDEEPHHYITADKMADHSEAVKIILHELRHAWQVERFREHYPDVSWKELYDKWDHSSWTAGPYEHRKIEVDARKAEQRYTQFLPVVVPYH